MLPAVDYFGKMLAISQTQNEVVNKVDNTDVLMKSSLKVDVVKLKSEGGKILIEMKICVLGKSLSYLKTEKMNV